MNWRPHAMVVPADYLDLANRVAHIFDPDTGGARTFGLPCSANGQEPATHYATSVPILQEHAPLLSDTQAFYQAMLALGAARGRAVDFSQQDVDDLMGAMSISTGGLMSSIESMGLVVITPPGLLLDT